MQQIADGRIADRRHRPFIIKERLNNVDTPLDLSGLEVLLHYRKPSATAFTTLTASVDDELEVTTPAAGLVKIKPDRTFFDETGEWELYFEVVDVPELAAPDTEMMVIRIKDGKP